jgi:hypoxanthine-guanine phosphoribosyltransferase
MHLNCEPKFRSKAIENKTIFIMDDFITEGFTTEWARNLLYNANAKMVITGAIGAFHSAIEIQNIDNSIKWDSYSPVDIDAKYIHSQIVFGKEDTDALDEVANSYKEVGGT